MHITFDNTTLKELGEKLEKNTLNRDAFIKLIEAAKELGLELQSTDEYGDFNMSIIFPVVEYGYLEMFKLLFSFGDFDVNSKFSGYSSLQYAAEEGHEDIAKILISHPDIDVNAGDDRKGQTPLHCATGNSNAVRLLHDHPKIDIESKDCDGETPLFCSKNGEIAQIPLDCGANPNFINNDGDTPLTGACYDRDLDHVRVLENGADPLIGEKSALEICGEDRNEGRGEAKRDLVQIYIDRVREDEGRISRGERKRHRLDPNSDSK